MEDTDTYGTQRDTWMDMKKKANDEEEKYYEKIMQRKMGHNGAKLATFFTITNHKIT